MIPRFIKEDGVVLKMFPEGLGHTQPERSPGLPSDWLSNEQDKRTIYTGGQWYEKATQAEYIASREQVERMGEGLVAATYRLDKLRQNPEMFKPVPIADMREDAIVAGLRALAARFGREFGFMRIDARGEIEINTKNAPYGEELAAWLSLVPRRMGIYPETYPASPTATWGRLNHFDAEYLLQLVGESQLDIEHARSLLQVRAAERLLKNLDTEEILLFNSASATEAAAIAEEGLVPRRGEWQAEIACLSAEDLNERERPVLFLSATPDWVVIKAARAAKADGQPYLYPGTPRDIVERYGQLSIVKMDKDTRSVIRRVDDGSTDPVFADLEGNTFPFYKSELYDHEGSFDGKTAPFREPPMCCEPGDFITVEEWVPEVTLTGPGLLTFLERHYPDALQHMDKALESNLAGMPGTDTALSHGKSGPTL